MSYVASLNTLEEVFYAPLLKMCYQIFIKPETIGKIFGPSRAITAVHTRLLSKLEQKMNKWGPDQTIGDVFISIIPDFEHYTHYVNNYNNAMEVLKKCLETPEFDDFLKKASKNPQCNKLDLPDFLIMPVQRLPRYQLLLSEVLQFTHKEDKDFDLVTKALAGIKKTTMYINEKQREVENAQRVVELNQKLVKGSSTVHNILNTFRFLL